MVKYSHGPEFRQIIQEILDASEVDLGIRWDVGRFLPSGARLLDDRLINDTLGFLRSAGHGAVLDPFAKGLSHLLPASKRPEVLPDVITDMYEALEAMAKIVTGSIGTCPPTGRHLLQELRRRRTTSESSRNTFPTQTNSAMQ